MRKLRWTLARWVYWSPLCPLWSWVAPRWTTEEIAAINKRARERAEWARRNFE